jgi:hypothetical protein
VTADGAGRNWYRGRRWNVELQELAYELKRVPPACVGFTQVECVKNFSKPGADRRQKRAPRRAPTLLQPQTLSAQLEQLG